MPQDDSDYYEQHATSFFRDTVAVEMAPLHGPFLKHLPANGHILDAGCGSGRDARAVLELGYRVTAFDSAPTLAALATEHLGQSVQVLRFEELSWHDKFDGIWACASLLHVPRRELPNVFQRLANALKPGGVLYCSFKYGTGEREAGGRRFTDLDEAGLRQLLPETGGLTLIEMWQTGDQRPDRRDERWLNALLRKPEAPCLPI
ncbi:class I SAM-dependent methyltransferase [Thiohalomonas denitrificans]|uniref:class I SAM-dependent methyltransferase n=1 Tax=Thiohalomonas denitrificans TaxID=415747 RepID=UPI0026E94AAE|nr:class I SAM-dependent methyltransferase [Thiohalomonas denitrificans]